MLKKCAHCDTVFEGRANKKYCSQACKSAVGNLNVGIKTFDIRLYHKRVVGNRGIIRKLYELYGNRVLGMEYLNFTKFDAGYNEGVHHSAEKKIAKVIVFGEYKVHFTVDKYFFVSKEFYKAK